MDLPILYLAYGLLVLIVVLVGISLSMVVFYFRLLKNYDEARKRQQELEVAARQQAEQVIRVAQKQAEMILEQSRAKAGETMQAAQILTDQSRAYLEQAITVMVSNQAQAFSNMLGMMQQQMKDNIGILGKGMNEQVNAQIGQVVEGIGQKMQLTQAAMQKNLMETYQKMEGELETYKKQRMVDYEKQLKRQLKRLLELTLKRTLTVKDQEQLVLEAFENAGKDGII